jgi:hypothetical protein
MRMKHLIVAAATAALGMAAEAPAAMAAEASVAQVWEQYVEAKKSGAVPPLPDFSYAGYAAGEEPIPNVEGPVFDVTTYGAKPDDGKDDQAAMQRAVDAAEAAGGGVVLLPAGAYDVNTDFDDRRPLRVRKGGVVLRGAGMGTGGTVIRIDQPTFRVSNDHPDPGMGYGWLQIGPDQDPEAGLLAHDGKLADVTADAARDSHVLTVNDASAIRAGDWVSVRISNSTDLARRIIEPYAIDELPEGWTRIRNGVYRVEHHKVKSVDGNRLTLREPLLTDVESDFGWTLTRYAPIERVGVEDICFQGGWVGKYSHHRSRVDDNAWEAVKFTRVADAWIRRCAIVNFNTCLGLESSAHVTALHNVLAGQMGHVSIGNPRRCTNLLIGLSADDMQRNGSRDTTHGIGSAGSGAGVVYWRYDMAHEESFDFHGMWPYATLFDVVVGGDLNNSGGPVASFPNHAELFVGWNFKHTYEPKYRNKRAYSFWGGSPRPTMVKPIFVGMHGVPVKFDEQTLGLNESQGAAVSPESLWEAQLALRLGGRVPAWVEEAKSAWAAMDKAPAPFPGGGQNTPWVAAKREQTIRLIMATPMVKDRYDPTDPVQFLVNEWPTADDSPFPPYLEHAPGTVEAGTKLRIVAGTDERVHYTLDGSDPTEESTPYTGPIELTRNTTVKAIAVKQGHKPSFVATATYEVKPAGATAAAGR